MEDRRRTMPAKRPVSPGSHVQNAGVGLADADEVDGAGRDEDDDGAGVVDAGGADEPGHEAKTPRV
jgi:hypothetical protein